MITNNRLFDLRRPGVSWEVVGDGLSENIVTSRGESLEAVNLTNSSLCADILIGPRNIWAGVTVGVIKTDVQIIAEMFHLATQQLVRLILPEQAAKLERYKQYPGYGWLEVTWSRFDVLELVEVQTNAVLWYAGNHSKGSVKQVVVMGLEDLLCLRSEAGGLIGFPQEFG